MYGGFDEVDVVVVGAGLGGLTAAAYLCAIGRRVIVVDQHNVAGGNATVFCHEDFEFDVGVHYLGDCGPGGPIPTILGRLGIDVSFRELDPDGFDTVIHRDGTKLRIPRDVELFRSRLLEAFGSEAEAVNAYVDTIIAMDRELAGQAVPDVVLRWMNATLADFYDEIGASERLRSVLGAQHIAYALPPSKASLLVHAGLAMHYFKGAFYPEGGGQVLADRLVEFISDHGGDVILRSTVEQILVEDARACGIRLRPPSPERAKGAPSEIRAPIVVSNADLKHTLDDLVGPEHFPDEFVSKVRGYEMAPPMFVHYLVIDRDLAAEGFANSNIYVVPHDDIEGDYRRLEAGAMPESPSVLMTFTSLKDPGNPRLCRPGQTNLQVMTPCPSDYAFWGLEEGPAQGERYRTNKTYLSRKREMRDRVLAVAEIAVPGISRSIVYEDTATAITHERFTRSTGGTSYGIAATPDQSALNRPAPGSPIEGLFFVGANVMPAHGIMPVMMSGETCAGLIEGRDINELVVQRNT
jgi:all-trans-retinol 13,14-reductase